MDSMVIILYFVVLALAFFLLIVLPQRRRATAHRAFVEPWGWATRSSPPAGSSAPSARVDDEPDRARGRRRAC